ncbi:MSMEG_0568 family radical SAM protein [Vibrio mangrovi]|uniref:MSMEG_0568 family radical SAM protein n=1 Tax=Vibrio mangrovi TaxID=474394 RepID=A0A1Y6J1P9_9VIBR|nr:MSMEG_0568 family radical SAM protein [Vibrio mangrovi]MDW6005158.1 MSMEG_0568 family radical SAM protein [Vibrio mangrovi]SMS02632.1 Radical SAM superfamily protein [Vibrio mangrovi]
MNDNLSVDADLLTEIQTQGVRLMGTRQQVVSRKGGAGPSDHQAMQFSGRTLMIPTFTQTAWESKYTLSGDMLLKNNEISGELIPVTEVQLTAKPAFYDRVTAEGVPFSHIATLHSTDVLATTVIQTCIRYENRRKACQFCSIGQSLYAGRTINRKAPEQLAEVVQAAVELDGIKHVVMTTGTPNHSDRGARAICESALAIKHVVDIPVQGQCEPPDDFSWFQKMKDAGIDSLGMHLEVITPSVRQKITPGKAEIPVEYYLKAYRAAVRVFGRGQVSTYILAGLGDSRETILEFSAELIDIGVYPFVVPFVPIRGTPLEDHPAPSSEFMASVLRPLSRMLIDAEMRSAGTKAGCVKCGACSSLSEYEEELIDECD